VLGDRKLFHFLLRRAYLAQKPLSQGPYLRHLPLLFGKEHNFRRLPVVASTPLRDRWSRIAPQVEKPRYRVALFAGCLIDFVYPEQAEAMLQLLKDRKVQVDFPPEQSCCGLPAKMVAEIDTAREVAIQNLRPWTPPTTTMFLTLCASCGSHIKENYPKLLADTPALHVRMQQMASKIIDFSSLWSTSCKFPLGKPREMPCCARSPTTPPATVPWAKSDTGATGAPQASWFGVRPAKDEDVCCGFGGSFSVEFPELSAELLSRKLDNVEATGATSW